MYIVKNGTDLEKLSFKFEKCFHVEDKSYRNWWAYSTKKNAVYASLYYSAHLPDP